MTSSTRTTIDKFNKKAADTEKNEVNNPFSASYSRAAHKRTDAHYGRPAPGSLTEKRGIKAGVHVGREILFLCELIDQNATIALEDGQKAIKFGPLFYLYAMYSDKLVGMLLRARKHGLVHFEGEMLYQKQDDEKTVTLLKSMDAIRQAMQSSGDPANCIRFV